MTEVDIVIISNASTYALQHTTETCLNTLHSSEKDIRFNTYVVESNRHVKYKSENVSVIYPDTSFGYNKYLNIGRKAGTAEYVCLCNNDLHFHEGWASAIIAGTSSKDNLLSASPFCKVSHPPFGLNPDTGIIYGYDVRRLIAGWCIFQKRAIYDVIGDLDENFIFWYADNDYSETIKYHGVKHGLVTDSYVTHLTSTTLKTRPHPERRLLTHEQKIKFEKKWHLR